MKTVEFTVDESEWPEYRYECSEKTNSAGVYVLASEAEAEIATLKAVIATPEIYSGIIEKIVSDEREYFAEECRKATERERVLREALERVTAHYEWALQGVKADNYQDVIDQARAASAQVKGELDGKQSVGS